MVDGLEEGRYILRTPFPKVNFMLNGCLMPRSPRPYPLLLDMLLAPLYVLQHWMVTNKLNGASHKILGCSVPGL